MKSYTKHSFESGVVETEVRLPKELADKLSKMTKKELIERLILASVECKVAEEKLKAAELRCKTAIEDADQIRREVLELQSKFDQCEGYVEQGRAMVEAITERWYNYD